MKKMYKNKVKLFKKLIVNRKIELLTQPGQRFEN